MNAVCLRSNVPARLASAILVSALLCSQSIADIGPILITGDAPEEGESPQPPGTSGFQLGDTAVGEHTGFVEILRGEQLQQAGSSVAEVVANKSGVQFKQSGGFGSQSSITLRASSSEQVNVYLDGILLNDAANGGVNLSDIELMQVDKIEVYKGTVPVQLGNSAIGGAVNITTARPSDAASTRLLLGMGSFNTSRFSAAFNNQVGWLDGVSMIGSLSLRQSDNNFPFIFDNGTHLNTHDDRRERRQNGQTRALSGFVKASHRIASVGFEHALQINQRSQGIANWLNSGSATLDSQDFQWRSTIRVDKGYGNWSSLWELNATDKNELFDDSIGSIGNTSQNIDSNTRVLGARAYWEKLNEGSNSLSFSWKVRTEERDSTNRLSALDTDANRLSNDVTLQRNWYFKRGLSLLSAGVSGFLVNDDYQLTAGSNDFSDSAILPRIGVSHAINDRWTVIGNLSMEKRVPTFFELFGSQGLFQGNARLKSEKANNIDWGLKWTSKPSAAIDQTLAATYFFSDRDDLIVRTYNAQGIGLSQNIARADVDGFEINYSALWPNSFSLDSSITVQDPINRSNIAGYTNKQLPGEAKVNGYIKASYRLPKWKLSYEHTVNSGRFYDSANFLKAPDQRLHNISVSRYWKDWRLDFELNNLTNQIYEDFNGYPKPGRAGFVSLYFNS